MAAGKVVTEGGIEINFEHSDSRSDVVHQNLLPLHLNPGRIMGLYTYSDAHFPVRKYLRFGRGSNTVIYE